MLLHVYHNGYRGCVDVARVRVWRVCVRACV